MSAQANTFSAVRSIYTFGDAGELTATATPNSFLSGYVPSTILGSGFQTFSAQADRTFIYGLPYEFDLAQSDSAGHVLTQGAALLYYDFSQGILPGYDYDATDPYGRTQSAGELQAALWDLQGYASPGTTYPDGGAGNTFYDYATNQLGDDLLAANNHKFSVDIVELWDVHHNSGQNLLVTTVPDNATTAALTGLAFVGLIWARRGPDDWA